MGTIGYDGTIKVNSNPLTLSDRIGANYGMAAIRERAAAAEKLGKAGAGVGEAISKIGENIVAIAANEMDKDFQIDEAAAKAKFAQGQMQLVKALETQKSNASPEEFNRAYNEGFEYADDNGNTVKVDGINKLVENSFSDFRNAFAYGHKIEMAQNAARTTSDLVVTKLQQDIAEKQRLSKIDAVVDMSVQTGDLPSAFNAIDLKPNLSPEQRGIEKSTATMKYAENQITNFANTAIAAYNDDNIKATLFLSPRETGNYNGLKQSVFEAISEQREAASKMIDDLQKPEGVSDDYWDSLKKSAKQLVGKKFDTIKKSTEQKFKYAEADAAKADAQEYSDYNNGKISQLTRTGAMQLQDAFEKKKEEDLAKAREEWNRKVILASKAPSIIDEFSKIDVAAIEKATTNQEREDILTKEAEKVVDSVYGKTDWLKGLSELDAEKTKASTIATVASQLSTYIDAKTEEAEAANEAEQKQKAVAEMQAALAPMSDAELDMFRKEAAAAMSDTSLREISQGVYARGDGLLFDSTGAPLMRNDGKTQKTIGWLGEPLIHTDAQGVKHAITELSIGVNIDGKDVEIPSVVPGLNEEEKEYIRQNGDESLKKDNALSKSIIQKAIEHAKERMSQGLSPYKEAAAGGKTFRGLRPDGTGEGSGWLGDFQIFDKDGNVVSVETEMSFDAEINGEMMSIPMLVPTLTQEEKDFLSKEGSKIPPDQLENNATFKAIEAKAIEHAKQRVSQNLSPYYNDGGYFYTESEIDEDVDLTKDRGKLTQSFISDIYQISATLKNKNQIADKQFQILGVLNAAKLTNITAEQYNQIQRIAASQLNEMEGVVPVENVVESAQSAFREAVLKEDEDDDDWDDDYVGTKGWKEFFENRLSKEERGLYNQWIETNKSCKSYQELNQARDILTKQLKEARAREDAIAVCFNLAESYKDTGDTARRTKWKPETQPEETLIPTEVHDDSVDALLDAKMEEIDLRVLKALIPVVEDYEKKYGKEPQSTETWRKNLYGHIAREEMGMRLTPRQSGWADIIRGAIRDKIKARLLREKDEKERPKLEAELKRLGLPLNRSAYTSWLGIGGYPINQDDEIELGTLHFNNYKRIGYSEDEDILSSREMREIIQQHNDYQNKPIVPKKKRETMSDRLKAEVAKAEEAKKSKRSN